MDDVYSSVKLSLFKLCGQFATAAATKLAVPAATLWNFDSFSEQNALPEGDIVGLRGYSLDLDTELGTVHTMFGIATQDDVNIMRLDQLTAILLKMVLPGTDIPIYDSETLALGANMRIASGVSVSPVFQAIQRPCKFISVQGKLSVPVQK